jgi:hypothetical protein
MNRYRIPIVVAVVVIFAAVGAFLSLANQSAGGKNVTIDLTVRHATSLSPNDPSAHLNDTVTINIASDTDGEVHLHGYDIHFETKAGQVVSQTFKAVNTGRFEMEWESTSRHLGWFTVAS